jgi:hypothetical protein
LQGNSQHHAGTGPASNIMAIKTVITTPASKGINFPALRLFKERGTAENETVVVLFTDPNHGILLSSALRADAIGEKEEFRNINEPCWHPCTLTLTSED